MIHINRKSRSAESSPVKGTRNISERIRPTERQDLQEARRRFITSRIRGANRRNNSRYLGHSRDWRARGLRGFKQTPSSTQRSAQRHPKVQNAPTRKSTGYQSQVHTEDNPAEQYHARDRPVAQPRIGEVLHENSQNEQNRFTNDGIRTTEPPNTEEIARPSDSGKTHYEVQNREYHHFEQNTPRTDEMGHAQSEFSENGNYVARFTDISTNLPRPQKGESVYGEDQVQNRNNDRYFNLLNEHYRLVGKLNPVLPNRHLSAYRICKLLPNGTVAWNVPDASVCRGEAMQAAENTAKELASLTSSPSAISAEIFTEVAHKLARLVEHALHDAAVANNMMSALSNMMEVNDSVLANGDEDGNTTNLLIQTINKFTGKIPLHIGKEIEIRKSNLVVEARFMKIPNNTFSFRPLASAYNETSEESIKRQEQQLAEPYLTLSPQSMSEGDNENVRLEFVSYKNDKFFRGGRSVGLPVISAKVTNFTVTNLTEPIVYYIPISGGVDLFQPSCVYWDELARDWSNEGIVTVVTDGMVTCKANHLTAFSVLLDPLPAHLGVHEETLSIITYVGLALSTLGLAVTVATYTIFRTLNRDRSGKIVMNLSLALLLLNLTFLIATHLEPPSIPCTIIASVLHYFVLSAFAWMLVEGANMHQLLITVFASAETHFMVKRVIAAWGFPLLFVIIALTVDMNVYGDENRHFCVINPTNNPTVYYSTYMGMFF
ncbi:G-protein coupled receptor activity protein [Halocaridina rubra]|uniref:G-protein coupled receptor activity protein n=1 Tax=Halocaridina rubra TaxID=373956 RepID=A0AAN8ZYY1_HALRR